MEPLAFSVVTHVLSRLQGDLDEPWSMERLSRESGYSPSHLSRAFAEVTGVPPMRYLRHLRLERAAHDLEEFPEWSITEVALRAGYDAPEAFTRAFRRAFGVPPSSFQGGLPLAQEGQPRRQRFAPEATERPPGLAGEPTIVCLPPLQGWSIVVATPDPVSMTDALARLAESGPTPPPPFSLGGLSQPWGWSSRSFRFEIRLFRLTTAPVPPGLQPWRTRGRWWAQFEFSGPTLGMGAACQWAVEQWAPRSGLRVPFAPVLSLIGGEDVGHILLPITTLHAALQDDGAQGVSQGRGGVHPGR